jgi:hypothetical protein
LLAAQRSIGDGCNRPAALTSAEEAPLVATSLRPAIKLRLLIPIPLNAPARGTGKASPDRSQKRDTQKSAITFDYLLSAGNQRRRHLDAGCLRVFRLMSNWNLLGR